MKTLRLKKQTDKIIYKKNDRFAGWPFNSGVYKYKGDEVVVGFHDKYCPYEQPYQLAHDYYYPGKEAPIIHARSYDGGITWDEKDMRKLTEVDDFAHRAKFEKEKIGALDKPMDFKNPDLLIFQSVSEWCTSSTPTPYILLSEDKGKSFKGPFRPPWARFDYTWGRPDYVIREDGACVLFTCVSRDTERNTRGATLISKNGGISWSFHSIITPENPYCYQIMPSGVLLPSGEMVVALRVEINPPTSWSECYSSMDGGRTWKFTSRINDMGSPCHLLLLDDKRILATYGYRHFPFGIRASISEDNGRTWGDEIILRDDGGSHDLGYPKSVQLDNGEIFTAYYFNDKDDKIQINGGVRYIAGTRWNLDAIC
jgi:hypothetical protein